MLSLRTELQNMELPGLPLGISITVKAVIL